MAEKKVIELEIKSNFTVANKNIKDLDTSLSKLESSTDNVTGSMKESSLSVLENGGAMGLLNDATGGLAMTVKDAVEATALFAKQSKISTTVQAAYTTVVGASTGAMKFFRLALVGTGIGAIVVGLGLLIANFDKVKKAVMNLIPGLADVADFFGGIIENITDFVGATSEAERAMARMTAQADKSLAANKKFLQEEGDQINKYTKAKIDAKNAYNEALKEDGANQVKLAARLNRELLAVDKLHKDDLEKSRKETQDKQNAIREKNSQESIKKSEEEKKKLEEIEKERQELIGRQGAKAREEYEAAEKLIADARKANEDVLKTENQIKVEKEIADFELKKANLLSKNLSIEEIEAEHKRKLGQLDNEFFAKEADNNIKATADAKAAADAQNAIEQGKFDLKLNLLNQTASAIGGLGALFKKGTAAAKAAALAEIAIGSAVGLINGLDIAQKSAKGTGPAAAFAFPLFYATQVAAVFGAVSRAKGILSSAGGSASTPSVGGGNAPSPNVATAAPNFNVVGASSTNQLAQTIGQQQNQPIKAYVVANDVTTQQSLDRNIVKSATIG